MGLIRAAQIQDLSRLVVVAGGATGAEGMRLEAGAMTRRSGEDIVVEEGSAAVAVSFVWTTGPRGLECLG